MLWSCQLRSKVDTENNVMNILHCAIEDDTIADRELTKAISAIMEVVNAQAHEYSCNRTDMWTPGKRIQDIIAGLASLQGKLVCREKTRIASLRWFGQGSVSEVEWVDNEKFGWC